MNVFEDSPLDTQAFNYLSFGFLALLNNLWTRLSLSFWRNIPALKPELQAPSRDPPSDKPDPVQELLIGPHADSGPPRVPTVVGNGAAEDVDGVVTKGKLKFTLYYEDIDDRECESDETLTGEFEWEWEWEWEEREGIRGEWWESCEKLLRMRTGEDENGWYTCQDLTALNGNVVKFWDGVGSGFATFAKEPNDRSSCVRVW